MPFSPLVLRNRTVRLQKCIRQPDFTTRTILVDDQWDYVKMWLNREQFRDAMFFWNQAKEFHKASQDLPPTSSPLTKYYCALNATKAFLLAKNVPFTPYHGLSGEKLAGSATLPREIITIKGGGVLPSLCTYLGEPAVNNTRYTLKDVLYNLPYIHRAYTLTFISQPELFIPVAEPLFVRIDGGNQCWICFEITDTRFQSNKMLNSFANYERDIGVAGNFMVRKRQRFNWVDTDTEAANLGRLTTYHDGVRRSLFYIRSLTRLWYLKRDCPTLPRIGRSSLSLTFMALHRLSEIARYNPDALARHFDSQHNWVLSEFISVGLDQYLDELASEMTGHEFMSRGYSPR